MCKKNLIVAMAAMMATLITSCSSSEGVSCPRVKEGEFNVSPTTINLYFQGNEDVNSYKIEVGPTGFVQGSGTSQVTSNTSVSISNLTPSTTYDVFVSSICSAEDQSKPFKMSAITTSPSQCTEAASLAFTQYNPSSINLLCSYGSGSTPKKFEVEYGPRGFALGTGTKIATAEYGRDLLINSGIQPSTNYDFYIRAVCWASDVSAYTKFEYTTLEACPRPSNLSYTVISGSCNQGMGARYALSWHHLYGNAQSYEVSIVTNDNINNPDNGNISIFSTNGAQYSGMYCLWKAFYVRANCGNGSVSAWAGPYYF